MPMATDSTPLSPPTRWESFKAESKPLSLFLLICSAVTLAVAILFPLLFSTRDGIYNHEGIASRMVSGSMTVVLLANIAFAGTICVWAAFVWKRMETRVARNQATSAVILSVESLVVSAALAWFFRGNMLVFARTFLNFEQVSAWTQYFLLGMAYTLLLSIASIALGIALGLVNSIMLISSRKIVRAPARLYVNLVRGTPVLVQLSVIYFGLALGLNVNWSPQTALIVTLGINNGAYIAEVFRAGLQSIHKGQLNASRGLGMSYAQALRYVIVPQAVRNVIPPLMNDFINIVKETSLIIFLGVTLSARELYSVASQGYSQYFNSTFYVAAAAGYLVITLPLIRAVTVVERRIRGGLVNVGS